jgi:cytochrome b6-f complex iron-sulfur subunit
METRPAWQEDFPVSWVDDRYVTRRDFTKSLVLVSGAASAASASILAFAADGTLKTEPVRVGSVSGLPVGGWRLFRFDPAGMPCLLVRLDEDRFAAYGQKCTHLGCPVLYEAKRRRIHCPCHEGWFDAEDGRVLAGPPPRPLVKVDLERRGDELWATGLRR